jgi:NADH dehydrogenase
MGGVRILVIEGAPAVLGTFHPGLRRAAARALESKGITLILGALVGEVEDGCVRLRDGREPMVGTVIWTAGVRGNPLGASLGVELARGSRITVEPTLQLPGHPEVFVVGDLAAAVQDGAPLPMLSPVAMQEGAAAARNILALAEGRAPEAFHYRNRGTMATIGRNQAVAELGPLRFAGRLAWFAWLFVHLAFIIGLRNRVIALLDWAVNYVFYDRPVRLITGTASPASVGSDWDRTDG